ncbi:MAG: phosphodiester glycosidase family protein [Clostridia bacterium]|nr:phosphodiester glycosidase family protein [Clostridia bacterium]
MRAGKLVILVLTVMVMTICMLGSAMADIKPIPLDMLEHGTPPKAECWLVPGKEYEDESIHVILDERRNYKSKSSDGNITIRWAVIEIKDPSQLRTALSYDSFENKDLATAPEMVAYLNPVVAFNDDYVKMNNYKGYVMRQGVLYSDNLDEWSDELKQDVLIIDDQGDFSVVQKATSADVQARIAELEGEGRQAINTFTFGPTLVLNGEAQEIKGKDSTHTVITATARTAFCQLDTLKYAVFAADCPQTGYGINCQELANFIVKTFPECKVAYNLDGGGSSRLFMGQKKVNKAMGRREIYGMIYFASAVSED